MEDRSVRLNEFAASRSSQFGEDGIIEKLFSLLSIKEGYFCEFGALDGKCDSNTYELYTQGWSGCYIEGDPKRFAQLERNISNGHVANICQMVGLSDENSLDTILQRVRAPTEFDLLSIDIDSDDLAVWRSLSIYRPKCVIIEYNPTIPIGVEYENRAGQHRGNSSTSICKLAKEKHYVLVAQTKANLVFLRQDLFDKLPVQEHTLEAGMHWFLGYDGTLLEYSEGTMREQEWYDALWSNVKIVQPYPRFWRQYKVIRLRKLYSFYCLVVTRPWLVPGWIIAQWRK